MTNQIIQFRASSTLANRIKEFAAQHDLNTSEACRNLIALQLERQERLVTADKLLQILSALGYERISDIPAGDLDNVVKTYLETVQR